MKIPLSCPDMDQADIDAVVAVLRSGRLSLGKKLEEFESKFASDTGTPHAVAVSSGTAALHLAMRALDIGEGDEVIVPSLAFRKHVPLSPCNCRPHKELQDIVWVPVSARNGPFKRRRGECQTRPESPVVRDALDTASQYQTSFPGSSLPTRRESVKRHQYHLSCVARSVFR
jgi:DegT/DnrJ/EryC1/StrS aminotransferase family